MFAGNPAIATHRCRIENDSSIPGKMVVRDDGSVVIAGDGLVTLASGGQTFANHYLSLTSTGATDTLFGGDGVFLSSSTALDVLADGSLLELDGAVVRRLARDSSPFTAWGVGGSSQVFYGIDLNVRWRGLLHGASGRVVAGTLMASGAGLAIVARTATGSSDLSFGTAGVAEVPLANTDTLYVRGLVKTSDGRLVVYGTDKAHVYLARFFP